MADNKDNLEKNMKLQETKPGKQLSDEVVIEIVHAFKDIIIEFITRKYQSNN